VPRPNERKIGSEMVRSNWHLSALKRTAKISPRVSFADALFSSSSVPPSITSTTRKIPVEGASVGCAGFRLGADVGSPTTPRMGEAVGCVPSVVGDLVGCPFNDGDGLKDGGLTGATVDVPGDNGDFVGGTLGNALGAFVGRVLWLVLGSRVGTGVFGLDVALGGTEGDLLGVLLGNAVGFAVGGTLGLRFGSRVGRGVVGRELGTDVGITLGCWLGGTDGDVVGSLVGLNDGAAEGASVEGGLVVGTLVGERGPERHCSDSNTSSATFIKVFRPKLFAWNTLSEIESRKNIPAVSAIPLPTPSATT
jgi:hypothetical protein